MAVIKCKMCGGDLNIAEGMSVAECEYCGTRQTVPNVDNEKKLTLFSRANRLRLACEFDKASSVYESIVAEFPEEAEAYWGLVLCRYGIEYVDDPATGKKVPTCHRSSFESILEDGDFEQACENADAVARKVYRDEAKAIEEIRKGILEVSGKEPPYDIFICYKETDETGNRTTDSVLAQDVYDALAEKGYRVFFARITLEDKLGTEYEPYIFAALNSAKVMLAFGTDYEYFNAVWVKNEWSRFLKLMAQDKSKYLIPCYKDVDAYDMPKEFQKLQAQDMGKVGAIQDLLRGLDKLLGKRHEMEQVQGTVVIQQSEGATWNSLLERGFIFLEDGDFTSANTYFDKVLDIAPRCAEAYVGKLCIDYHCNTKEGLQNSSEELTQNQNYIKAIRFATTELKKNLEYWNRAICDRLGNERRENMARLQSVRMRSDKATQHIICGSGFTVGLKSDRTVVAAGDNRSGGCNVANWADIETIACGGEHTVGLKSDGTVVATGDNGSGECDVANWTDIKDIACGLHFTVGLKSDGTVVAAGDNFYKLHNVTDWTDIVAIACDESHAVGLKSDGTVVATGNNQYGQCEVSNWSDIVYVTCVACYTAGIKSDGSVVATGNNEYGQCEVANWSDIVAIACGENHVVGLKSDGTVVAVGSNESGQCEISTWTDIVSIICGARHTVGLKSNGTVVAVGENNLGQCNVENLSEIVAIACDGINTAGLKSDGTVVVGQKSLPGWRLFQNVDAIEEEQVRIRAEQHKKKTRLEKVRNSLCKLGNYIGCGFDHVVGLKSDGTVLAMGNNENGQCEVATWTNIVAIACGWNHTIGLQLNGRVLAVGNNENGQCKVKNWSDIVAVVCGWNHTVGLQSSGRVVAVGDSKSDDNFGQCNVTNWSDIVAIACGCEHTVGLKKDHTVVATGFNGDGRCNVTNWSNVTAIACGWNHTIGLRSDGTVLATGKNTDGQCNVEDWSDIIAIAGGNDYTVGLKSDGTVVAVGDKRLGKCDVASWSDIIAITGGENYIVGLKSDGRVVAVGDDFWEQCNVTNWLDVVAIACCRSMTVGIKSDGTVVTTGKSKQYSVSTWRLFQSVLTVEDEWKEYLCRAKEERCKQLEAERSQLQEELLTVKGLFSGIKRNQIEVRLAQIEQELKKL